MKPRDGDPGSSKSNQPDGNHRPARFGPPPQGQTAQQPGPRFDPQRQSLLQTTVPSNDNFVVATRCTTLDGSGLVFHGDGLNMLVPFSMLDKQNQLRFGHTDKYESLDWLAVASLQKPGPDFLNGPPVANRARRQPQPPAHSNTFQAQPSTTQTSQRGRRSGRDAAPGNKADNGESPSDDKRVGRSRGPRKS